MKLESRGGHLGLARLVHRQQGELQAVRRIAARAERLRDRMESVIAQRLTADRKDVEVAPLGVEAAENPRTVQVRPGQLGSERQLQHRSEGYRELEWVTWRTPP